jgi:acyl-CoA synthetase (AMP-forming)/AMP-acid ligase II
LAQVIDTHQVKSSFGSPTLWKKLADWARGVERRFPSISRIFIAGAPVNDEVIAAVRSVVPDGEVYIPYGATEALPVSVISGAERIAYRDKKKLEESLDGQKGLPIGRTVKGVSVQVMPLGTAATEAVWEAPCKKGEIGELWVSGPTVSPGYLHRTGDNCSKRVVDGTWWHALGDVGYVGRSGVVYFCGRIAHIVRGSRLWCSIPVERIANQVEGVRRSALVDLGDGRAGVVIEPHDPALNHEGTNQGELINKVLAALMGNQLTAEIDKVFVHPSFPVDGRHNAKIFRDRLSVWAQNQGRSAKG